MTAEQLRNSILQEAISGRLVPRDPNDEPASVLLQHIREEKARLVKEGKLKKKDLADTPITEEEIPFEIPTSWEWVRLVDIGYFMSGKTPKSEELSSIGNIPYFKVSDMNVEGNELYMNNASLFLTGNAKYKIFPKNAIIYPKNGGALLTNKKRILVKDSLVDLNTGAYVPSNELNITYVYYLFSSIDFRKHHKGTALPTVDMNSINKLIFPLPPLAEQKRIVAKLEELLPIVEQYGKAQTELDELNAALPARLRQSILQEAISGRLVPQDPNEDADDVKTIEIEDAPFEIPNNWRWCSLGDLVDMVSGTSYKKDDVRTKGVRILRGGNIVNDELVLAENDVFLPDEYANLEKNIRKDDIIIVASTGSQKVIGKPALIRQNYDKTQIGAFLRIIRAKDVKYVPFLWLIFKGMYYREHIRNLVKGTNINNIKEEYITTLPIPLPPLAEQARIVAKIEELFAEIDKLK